MKKGLLFCIVLKVNLEPLKEKYHLAAYGRSKDGIKKRRLGGPMTRRQTANAKFTVVVGTDQIQTAEATIRRKQVDRKDEDCS